MGAAIRPVTRWHRTARNGRLRRRGPRATRGSSRTTGNTMPSQGGRSRRWGPLSCCRLGSWWVCAPSPRPPGGLHTAPPGAGLVSSAGGRMACCAWGAARSGVARSRRWRFGSRDGEQLVKSQARVQLRDNRSAHSRPSPDVQGRIPGADLGIPAFRARALIASHRRGHWFDPSIAHSRMAWSEALFRASGQAVRRVGE
jgi:hypothetical protein